MCLKISRSDKSVNERDLKAYHYVRPYLQHYIAAYGETLVATNLGPALACELIRDSDGVYSPSYATTWKNGTPSELVEQFHDFFARLQKHRLFFYDFNPKNFLVQQTENRLRLRYIDLKSLGQSRSLLGLEALPFFAKRKMIRRRDRFMNRCVYSTLEET